MTVSAEDASYKELTQREKEPRDFPPLLNDLLVRAARGLPVPRYPVWVMRQAGRYLSEYHLVGPPGHEHKPEFFTRCEDTALAVQTTLQPLARFRMDAAVVFNDILIIPRALGRALSMVPGKGPVFDAPLEVHDELLESREPAVRQGYSSMMRVITGVRHRLAGRAATIGFAGGPWTLLSYMIEGASSKVWMRSRSWLYEHPAACHRFLRRLSDTLVLYLVDQVRAGAQALQVFESNCGVLSRELCAEFVTPYLRDIASRVHSELLRQGLPSVPLIAFPRGAPYLVFDLETSDYDVVSLDWNVDAAALVREANVSKGRIAFQGNLDPAALFAPVSQMPSLVIRMLSSFPEGYGHIVNLGHGINLKTSPEHVAAFVDAVHAVDPRQARLRLGTRGSALALEQTRRVQQGLSHSAPQQLTSVLVINSAGDLSLDVPLKDFKQPGIFCRALEERLLGNDVDALVHSMKDLSSEPKEGTVIAAVLPRASAYDALLLGPEHANVRSLEELPAGFVVGTSSVRRAAQLRAHVPGVKVVELRGNVETRLRKLRQGTDGIQAIVMAQAALDRLHRRVPMIALDNWCPSVAQGAICVQVRADDERAIAALAPLDHAPTRLRVDLERAIASSLDLGCHTATAVHARYSDESTLELRVQWLDTEPFIDQIFRVPVSQVQDSASVRSKAEWVVAQLGIKK